jgi:hypothetical protein
MDGWGLVFNPFSAASRAATCEGGEAIRWYARARNGEQLATQRFRHGLPDLPVRALLIQAVCALIQLERTAERYRRAAALSPEQSQGLTQEICDTADELWKRAHRIGDATREVAPEALSSVLRRESSQLNRLVTAITAAHMALIQQSFTGSASLGDRERYFRAWTQAQHDLTQWHSGGDER